jgi:glycopeptide antibiotics resistance protein
MSRSNIKIQSILLYTVLVFYVILFLSILIFKNVSPLELLSENRPEYRSVNILPFQTIKKYLMGTYNVSRTVAFNNVLGNIGLFIPLGIYLQLFKREKRILTGIFLIVIISLSVEILQFIFAIGATDIDDILLNCLGGIIGIMCYKLLTVFIKDDNKIRTAITLLSSIVGIPLLCVTILLLIYH